MPKNQLMKHLSMFHAGQQRQRNRNPPTETITSNSGQVNFNALATSIAAALQSSSAIVPKKRQFEADEGEISVKKKKKLLEYSNFCSNHVGLTSCFMSNCSSIHGFISEYSHVGYNNFCNAHANSSACFCDPDGCDAVADWMIMNGFVPKSQIQRMIDDAIDAYKETLVPKNDEGLLFILYVMTIFVMLVFYLLYYVFLCLFV